MLWGAFAGLTLLVVGGVGFTISILRMEQRREYAIVQETRDLLDAVRKMDEALTTMVSSARGYYISRQTAFEQQYADAVREFGTAQSQAREGVKDPRDAANLNQFSGHFGVIRELTDAAIEETSRDQEAKAREFLHAAWVERRSAPDYAELITERVRKEQADQLEQIAATRQWLMMAMIIIGAAVIVLGAVAAMRIEQHLGESIARQVRRTEAMIGGMSDGVLLVDGEGRTVFINPAGQRLLGKSEIGVPIQRQAEVYRLRDEHGRTLDPQELPAAQALSTGKTVQDVTILIAREAEIVAVSMSATPLHEDDRTSGVVVTFRDITERRALEEQMQIQAERAQIL
ncbi:MAG TPA: PAS domain-containing protein, partial [Thermoanaerobaculia bacterium]|nr:PAS domain-containing protein [Thermoanaerobaculia bacterium]